MSNIFWIKDPSVLFKNGNYKKILPKSTMSCTEKYNAVTRLFILLLIIFLVLGYTNVVILLIVLIVLTVFLYNFTKCDKRNIKKIIKNNIKLNDGLGLKFNRYLDSLIPDSPDDEGEEEEKKKKNKNKNRKIIMSEIKPITIYI